MDPGYIYSMYILLRLSVSNRDFLFVQFKRKSLEKTQKTEYLKKINISQVLNQYGYDGYRKPTTRKKYET